MNVQVSPDGKWWWNGQAWTPVGTYAAPEPARVPGVLVAAVVIDIVGGALTLLLAIFFIVVSRGTDVSGDLGDTGIDPASMVLAITVGVIAYGVYLTVLNSALGWLMIKRHAWAWITTVILISIGILVQLLSAIGAPAALIWIVIFQVPPMVLLLLGPSRRWCHISGGKSQQLPQNQPYSQYTQPYAAYQPTPLAYPPPPPAPPPQH